MFTSIFGASKGPEPAELAKQWKRELAKEARKLERDMGHLKREEQKSMNECKKLCKEGHTKAAKTLAKEIVNTRRAIDRMHVAKTQLNSVSMQLQTTASLIKMQGCMAKSVEVMHVMNQLISIPEISQTMRVMAREMERSGLIDELISDTLEAAEPVGLQDEADKEVNRIIDELTADILAPAANAPTKALPKAAEQEEVVVESPEDIEELRAMQARLQGL